MGKKFIIQVKAPEKPKDSTPKIENDVQSIDIYDIEIDGNRLILSPRKGELGYNREIAITIKDKLKSLDGTQLDDTYEMWYTSTYYPIYSLPTMVRLTEGIAAFLNNVPDDTIWRTILKNSIYAIDFWGTKSSYSNGMYGSRIPNNNGNVPWCVKRFVTYATVLDLMGYIMANLTDAGGMKVLADLTIDNRAPSYNHLALKEWRERIAEIVDESMYRVKLKCGNVRPSHGIRGINYWEPIPIIEPEKTWKRWPKFDHVSSFWHRMYPASAAARITNVGDAYHVGVYPVSSKSRRGGISQGEKGKYIKRND